MPSITLDANVVKNAVCPPEKSRLDLYDTAILGFIVEVRATGSKTYYLRYRDQHGKQKQYKIGDTKAITFDQAKAAAQTLKAKVTLGENPSLERQTTRQIITLKIFVEQHYLPYIKSCKRGWKINLSTLKHHILPTLGDVYLNQLNQQMINKLLFSMQEKGYAPATINRVLTMLRYMYNLAKRWEIQGVDKNPTAGIPRFVDNNSRENYLNSEQAAKLLEAVKENSNTQLKYIVMLLLLTACRKREILDAKWVDVDFATKMLRVPLSKNGKPRYVPLSEDALNVLRQVPRFEGCPYVVPNPKTLKPFNCIDHSWQNARKKAGLPDFRCHDLRHSAASALINSGRSLYEVQKLLGHTNASMTQRYAHLTQEKLLEAANSISSSLKIAM
jgi:integrase